MSYAVYLRKSRADMELESTGELETLARHEKTLLAYAEKMKCSITGIYKEIVSGESIASRPEMQKLLTAVESGLYDGVFVMEIERLARGDTMDQGLVAQTFKYSKTKILTPAKIYDPENEFDEEYFEFGLFMSRREYKTINRRIQRGRIASVQEGKFIASQAPFGYQKVKLEKEKGYTLEPDGNAETVKLIYDLYVNQNMGMTAIGSKLDQLHMKPMKSSNWARDSIGDILSNPVYAGKIRWSYKKETKKNIHGTIQKSRHYADAYILVDGLHQAIITEELFEQAQQIRKKRLHPPSKKESALKNPLSGILYCGKCGRMMTRLASNPKNKYDTLKCPNIKCDTVSSPAFLIEKKLLESLKIWLSEYRIILSDHGSHAYDTVHIMKHTLKQIISDLDKLQKQLYNTYDLLEQEIYSKEEFSKRKQTLSDKIRALNTEKKDLEIQISAAIEQKNIRSAILPSIEMLLEHYSVLPSAGEKNMILKTILKKAVYMKSERNTRGKLLNDNFELVLYPLLPLEIE